MPPKGDDRTRFDGILDALASRVGIVAVVGLLIGVNLGAGLDARFTRLDNGLVHWFDLDFPDVIRLRSRSKAACCSSVSWCLLSTAVSLATGRPRRVMMISSPCSTA